MTVLPLNPTENASPEALLGFLAQCQAAAARDGRVKLVSISVAVEALDPLAVLESIFEPAEPHFYAERPSIETAVAGAEVAAIFTAHGSERFAQAQRWIDETLAHTIAVGDVNAPFGGPHFFGGFTFDKETEAGEAFDSACVFVPRWQVARAGAITTAVANLAVTAEADLTALTERVWRAHAKFRRFEYGRPRTELGRGTGVPPVEQTGSDHGRDAHATTSGSDHGRDAHAATSASDHGQFAHATTESRERSAGGTGVPPVEQTGSDHGRDAHATPRRDSIAAREVPPVVIRQGAYLPHWTREGAIYAVTFRLSDSLPPAAVERWRLERAALIARSRDDSDRPISASDKERLLHLHSEKIEALLDAGQGECWLRRPEVAEIVARALGHFDGERYELHDWCVMPNHVHAVLRPLGDASLASVVQAWKSFTAKAANRLLARTGEFWQAEYYDHLVRDESDYARIASYIRANPARAGLSHWKWCSQGSGGGTGVPPVEQGDSDHGRDAHATTDAPDHGRGVHASTGRGDHGGDSPASTSPAATVIVERTEHGDYRAAVARALERIAAGEFKKIVLARAQDIRADQALHPLEMLNGLRQKFPDCYSFSFAQGRGPSFIGASPERLVRVSKNVLETEALAGSMRRGSSASEDAALAEALRRSEKDQREQQEVLDDIVARLTPLGVKVDYPPRPQLRRLANVQHLHTPVRATLPETVRLLDVLAALHPTPAVGGSPRDAAIGRIRELEGFPRGLYAGALGWLNARGGGEFFVGIRSALVDGSSARVYAGAGIVAGSTPEKEFAETELKFKAMLEALLP